MASKRKSVSPSSAENLGPTLDGPKPEDVKPDVKTIDINEIQRLAAEIDVINKQEEGTKRKRKPKTTAPRETSEPEEKEPLFEPDPEFRFMIGHVTSGIVEGIKNKLDWTDPGLQWKEKVGLTVFKLSQRIRPMGDSWLTDIATLAGYFGLWSASNVLVEERASQNPSPLRDNGKREDVQAKRTLGEGAEGYTL